MISFQPNCTFPITAPSGFIRSPNIRSTIDIVWTCVSVIILSTWSVLHLTVPPDLKPQSTLQKTLKKLYILRRKLSWMAIMLAFPEYLVSLSTANLFTSWVNTPGLKELAEDDEVPWSLTHTVLANLGGVAIRFSDASKRELPERRSQQPLTTDDMIAPERPKSVQSESKQNPQPMLSNQGPQPGKEGAQTSTSNKGDSSKGSNPSTQLGSGGMPKFIQDFRKSQERYLKALGEVPWAPCKLHIALAETARRTTHWPSQDKDLAALHGNVWILDSKQLALARRCGIIQKLPFLTIEEINDKSKSDGLVRSLAVVQVLWLAVQLMIRRIANVPFTALEISTVAFAACAFIIYLAEWPKPKDVGVPIYLDTHTIVSPSDFLLIAQAAPTVFLQARHYYTPSSAIHRVVEGKFQQKHVEWMIVFTTILSIALFGGIHLFAWNLDFPTNIEQLLWRAAALTVAIAPTVSALLVLLESVVRNRTDQISKWSVIFLAPAYLSARLYIIVESFRSLYFLPPGAFISTWAANAPHVG